MTQSKEDTIRPSLPCKTVKNIHILVPRIHFVALLYRSQALEHAFYPATLSTYGSVCSAELGERVQSDHIFRYDSMNHFILKRYIFASCFYIL